MEKGNKLEATKNATALVAYLSTFNLGTKLVKDIIVGRDINPDALPKQALYSFLVYTESTNMMLTNTYQQEN